MKNIILLVSIFIFCSCSSVKVFSDFDHSIDFSNYETFAYFKPEIDKVDNIFKIFLLETLFP